VAWIPVEGKKLFAAFDSIRQAKEKWIALFQPIRLPTDQQGPILRILNLQLQRQRCSKLDRFFKLGRRKYFFAFQTH
jgi:hypothetical protein